MSGCPVPNAREFDYADRSIGEYLHEVTKSLRAESDAVYSEKHGGHWVLTGYDAIVAASLNPEVFAARFGVTIPPSGHVARTVPLESDPPEHTKYRKFLLPRFRKAEVKNMEADVLRLVSSTLDRIIERGECDLVEALTDPVPCVTIAELMGLPDEDHGTWRQWSVDILRANYQHDADGVAKYSQLIGDYLRRAIESRRGAEDDGGLLWRLANGEVDGEPVQPEMALGMAILVLLAGHETTAQSASTMFYLIATRPDLRETLIADRSRIPDFIEESLRYDTSVTGMSRTTVCPYQVDGRNIAEGERVLLLFTSGNHDERVFPNADEFDLDRRGRPHLAFGWGPHRCLGEHVARLELRIMIEEVLDRMPDFALPEGFVPEWGSGSARGVRSLPIRFTPSASRVAHA